MQYINGVCQNPRFAHLSEEYLLMYYFGCFREDLHPPFRPYAREDCKEFDHMAIPFPIREALAVLARQHEAQHEAAMECGHKVCNVRRVHVLCMSCMCVCVCVCVSVSLSLKVLFFLFERGLASSQFHCSAWPEDVFGDQSPVTTLPCCVIHRPHWVSWWLVLGFPHQECVCVCVCVCLSALRACVHACSLYFLGYTFWNPRHG